eukprot:5906962-Prymnesium_polylepis.2
MVALCGVDIERIDAARGTGSDGGGGRILEGARSEEARHGRVELFEQVRRVAVGVLGGAEPAALAWRCRVEFRLEPLLEEAVFAAHPFRSPMHPHAGGSQALFQPRRAFDAGLHDLPRRRRGPRLLRLGPLLGVFRSEPRRLVLLRAHAQSFDHRWRAHE